MLPTRELVASLVGLVALASYLRGRFDESGYQVVVFAAAAAAIAILYLDHQPGRSSALAAITTKHSKRSPHIVSTFDRRDGSLTVKFEGVYMRQKMEEQKRLRQENPELWRKQLHERLERLKAVNEVGNQDGGRSP